MEKGKKHRELLIQSLEVQRNNGDLWCYEESRFFKMHNDDTQVENWMYIDLYEKKEDIDGMMEAIRKRMETDSELSNWRDEFSSILVPDSRKSSLWTKEYRVD